MTVSPRTGRFSAQRRFDYGRLVSVFDSYVSTGRVDLSCRKRGGGGARPDSSEFTALAAVWEAEMDDRGLAPPTSLPPVTNTPTGPCPTPPSISRQPGPPTPYAVRSLTNDQDPRMPCGAHGEQPKTGGG